MRIAQISDTHIAVADPAAGSRLSDLRRTVDAINRMSPAPDVVLHTGDVVHDATAEDYAAARLALSRLTAPLLATVGNRDRRPAFRRAFDFSTCGATGGDGEFVQYAADLAGVRLIAVDTFDGGSKLGGYCAARAERLTQLVEATSGRPILFFLHHPPVPLQEIYGPSLQFRDASEANLLAGVIARSPGVVGVIAGHVHRSRNTSVGGVPLSTMGSIAADLNFDELPASRRGSPVFHLHRIESGTISTASVVA